MITIILKDGFKKEVKSGSTILEIAKEISNSLGRNALAGILNGNLVDLRTKVTKDSDLSICTFEDAEGQLAFHHTSAHILAQGIKRLYPNAKLAIGPGIKDGFYYDIEFSDTLVPEDLLKIENEMKKIIKENLNIEIFELEKNEAINWAKKENEDYKIELINDLPTEEKITFYKQGEFVDLCAGPHLLNTGQVKAFKLTSIAGAYWRGDEKNKMLTRIYGTSFPKAKNLEEYLFKIEEAKKRDHRKLGKELELFTILEEGPGFPFFFPKGMIIKNILIDYWRNLHTKSGYVEISTPLILNKELWVRSGHWGHYAQNMYTTIIDDEEFAIKPMNCPGGMLAYKQNMHSYRDLPIRMGELGLVHRYEKSGALHGLMRVRSFTQDDAHLFMTKDQIKNEIKGIIKIIDTVYSLFGFTYKVELSTRPEDSMGSDEDWELATKALSDALNEENIVYKINKGDGAFYGPKIDFHLEDSLGRTWQCGTIQLDFQLPERFELEYISDTGEKKRPVVIHRVVFGSIERFIGILIEHFAGAFPLWISPVQVKVLSISNKYNDYASEIVNIFKENNIRADGDFRDEKIGYKIREARNQRTPYILVVGEKEMENKTVSTRSRKLGDEGEKYVIDLIERLKTEIDSREYFL